MGNILSCPNNKKSLSNASFTSVYSKSNSLNPSLNKNKSYSSDEDSDNESEHILNMLNESLDEQHDKEAEETKISVANLETSSKPAQLKIDVEIHYKKAKIKLFNGQDINEIRKRKTPFVDDKFKPSIYLITNDIRSQFGLTLCKTYNVNYGSDLRELDRRITWQKPKIISYQVRSGENEFVLDSKGRPFIGKSPLSEYPKYFSVDDIFQGTLGDCFLIAVLLGLVKNHELLNHIIPPDNSYKENIKLGAYHFRLWKLGDWYDVVIDDYLAVDYQYNLCFCKNLSYKNEYWVALLEKAIAK